MIKKLFVQAKKCAPCVIFFDEIDRHASLSWLLNPVCCEINLVSNHSIGGSREKNDDSSTKKVLTELLVQISSIHPKEQVTIVGATNRLYVVFRHQLHCASRKKIAAVSSDTSSLQEPNCHTPDPETWNPKTQIQLNLFIDAISTPHCWGGLSGA